MIWNDRTSGYLSRGGQMGTHDEITEEYFADSQVQVRIIRNTLRIYKSRLRSLGILCGFTSVGGDH